MKKLPVLTVMFILCLLVGVLVAVAQLRDLQDSNAVFLEDVVKIGSPFPDDEDEDADDGGVDCDPNGVSCDLPPYECPIGAVPFVVDGCWGGCVSFWDCASIECEIDHDCPARTHCEDDECDHDPVVCDLQQSACWDVAPYCDVFHWVISVHPGGCYGTCVPREYCEWPISCYCNEWPYPPTCYFPTCPQGSVCVMDGDEGTCEWTS